MRYIYSKKLSIQIESRHIVIQMEIFQVHNNTASIAIDHFCPCCHFVSFFLNLIKEH